MKVREQKILIYQMKNGRSPFNEWLENINDKRLLAVVDNRLSRVRLGNFGVYKNLGGKIKELKMNYGPGFRIYFAEIGSDMVLLLCAGCKKTQHSDIMKSYFYWNDYLERTQT